MHTNVLLHIIVIDLEEAVAEYDPLVSELLQLCALRVRFTKKGLPIVHNDLTGIRVPTCP